ncbi:hypothetical protein KEG38_52605 [Polyangium jinanense]|uniref:hypothetical protein n=1 Tax=Polyangium jinanense TaxID=2829994 RepID=UPI0023416FB5|nr:hypothetical protein [Polyangium jinanense]MDC3962567.1 hypothetical protein [Polyangium jinanense]
MGFTPFPYDITEAAVLDVYDKLAQEGDLYAFHTLSGVPWVEAGQGLGLDGYGQSVKDAWAFQKAHIKPDHKIYLGLTPLDDSRSKMADYWGAQEHMPLPPPWDTYDFNAPEVKAAYLSFCETAIANYKPDFMGIGIEVNLLKKNAPARWAAYVELQKSTYEALKISHPDLPVFVTLTGVDLLEGWTDANHEGQMAALADILPYTDILAISLYPYMSKYLADSLPPTVFADLAALAPGKPIAIAESGYTAQVTTLAMAGITFHGSPEKQDNFVNLLVNEAQTLKMPFVVNFVVQDYDALWQKAGGGDLLTVWRDTGFFDENGAARPAMTTWRNALARPLAH